VGCKMVVLLRAGDLSLGARSGYAKIGRKRANGASANATVQRKESRRS
jgi:hypothetical protein